ncbi:vegetative cell wall protein gp1-like isoform X1 [Mauremys reevesii]|uniref:vegetative cell wall protein gp1-like isoform X1 n=1 Tax=Mauremys reevesii TaxID=260615 RepID=UPI00193FB8C8|nr:vegetative cell wall protein gp1-like isoform X1 [Mauremys reevesii]
MEGAPEDLEDEEHVIQHLSPVEPVEEAPYPDEPNEGPESWQEPKPAMQDAAEPEELVSRTPLSDWEKNRACRTPSLAPKTPHRGTLLSDQEGNDESAGVPEPHQVPIPQVCRSSRTPPSAHPPSLQEFQNPTKCPSPKSAGVPEPHQVPIPQVPVIPSCQEVVKETDTETVVYDRCSHLHSLYFLKICF